MISDKVLRAVYSEQNMPRMYNVSTVWVLFDQSNGTLPLLIVFPQFIHYFHHFCHVFRYLYLFPYYLSSIRFWRNFFRLSLINSSITYSISFFSSSSHSFLPNLPKFGAFYYVSGALCIFQPNLSMLRCLPASSIHKVPICFQSSLFFLSSPAAS